MLSKLMVKKTNRLMMAFVVIIASLLTLSLTNTAFAAGGMHDKGSLQGEVVAVDHNTNTMTLRSGQIGQFPNDELNVFMTKHTKLQVCKSNEPLKDIHVGRSATVKYHELGGVAVADSILERC